MQIVLGSHVGKRYSKIQRARKRSRIEAKEAKGSKMGEVKQQQKIYMTVRTTTEHPKD